MLCADFLCCGLSLCVNVCIEGILIPNVRLKSALQLRGFAAGNGMIKGIPLSIADSKE